MFRLKSVSLSLLRCNDFVNFTRSQFSLLKYCSLAKLAIFWALQVEGQSCVNVPTQKCESVPVQVIGHRGHRRGDNIYHRKKTGRFIQEVSNLSMGILSGRYWIAFTGITLSCQPQNCLLVDNPEVGNFEYIHYSELPSPLMIVYLV